MHVIRNRDRGKRAFHFQFIHRGGELVIRHADICSLFILTRSGGSRPPSPAAFGANMIQQRVLRLMYVRHFVHRNSQFVMRVIPVYLDLAGAHAHHVSRQGERTCHYPEQSQPEEPHRRDIGVGATNSPPRARCKRTNNTRSVAITGTEKNMPVIPAICSPASTPNNTSTGLSST